MVKVCDNYDSEFGILFNSSKNKLLYFNGNSSNVMQLSIMVNEAMVYWSEKVVHLGHTTSTSSNDRKFLTLAVKSNLWKSFNNLLSNFAHLHLFIKSRIFVTFCCSFYGSPLWYLGGASVRSWCVDWRKSLRSLWCVHPMTHCNVIAALSNQIPIKIKLNKD